MKEITEQLKEIKGGLDSFESHDPIQILFTLINHDYEHMDDEDKQEEILARLSSYEQMITNFEKLINQAQKDNPTLFQKKEDIPDRENFLADLFKYQQSEEESKDKFNNC